MDKLNIANVKVLLVEDNPRYLEQLKKWLTRFGYQLVDSVRNAAEAKEKLQRDIFEIVVADMRLETDDSGGFVIINEVMERNINAKVIILTANDTVVDCRRAFKQRACWDYISKNMAENVFEELHHSIQEAIAYFNQFWHNHNDEEWIENNKEQLDSEYHGKYIAVINNEVIEVADTKKALKERVFKRNLPLYLPTFQKIGTETLADLIKQGESGTSEFSGKVEFKSTLSWDIRENKKNKALQFSVLKTIAAFMNTEGGTLLIGVEDDRHIFGLEKDISLLREGKQTLDGFELALRDIIGSNIGTAFSSSKWVKMRFERQDGKDVCIVAVHKTKEPVFIEENKQGHKEKQFFIRSGNNSRACNIEEMYHHLRLNCKK
jgi:ActR/RegA family two-component response regulator